MSDLTQVESFRGGYEELAAVIKEAWGQSKDQSLIFDEAFLRSAMEYPGCSLDLTAAIYVDGELAAFEAGFPRIVLLNGREHSLLCVTFWTASSRFQGKGYGSQVMTELLRRARKHGFDGAVVFCADGAASNSILAACAKRLETKASRVFSTKYLAKLLQPSSGAITTSNLDPIDFFLKTAKQVDKVPLIRRWSRAEAEWQCCLRSGSICSVLQKESRCGVCTGYLVPTRDSNVFLVEDLLWGDLESEERGKMLHDLLARAAAAGAQMVIAPLMGYAETNTLRCAGFRQTRRLMHMYIVTWNGTAIAPLSSAYLDVF